MSKNLCLCDCRKEVNEGRKYIRGHNNSGMIPWNKGLSKETDARVKNISTNTRKTIQKMYDSGEFIAPWLGKKRLGLWNGSREALKGMKPTKKQLDGLKIGWTREHGPTPKKTREKQSESRKKYITKNLEMFGYKMSPETVRKSLMRKTPTSLEKKMIEIINKNSLPYKFVGDGSFLIGNKNPDFVNVNGEKIAIEVYDRFFKLKHYLSVEEYERERINDFKEYGWKVIFFKENEVNEKKVLTKM